VTELYGAGLARVVELLQVEAPELLTVLVDVLPATSTKLRSAVSSVGGGFLTSWARVDGASEARMMHETAAAPSRIRIPRVIGGSLAAPAVHRLAAEQATVASNNKPKVTGTV